jgi:hypothetical protein
MSLNKIKTPPLSLKKQKKIPFFLNLPTLPQDSYLQLNSKKNSLEYFNFAYLLDSASNKNFRFLFSAKTLRTSLLLKIYARKLKKSAIVLKKYLHVAFHLLKTSKKYPFFKLKKIKGGLMTTSFGINTFVPKSHRSKVKDSNQVLIGFKMRSRKKKFSFKRVVKLNMVSSSRPSSLKKYELNKKLSRINKRKLSRIKKKKLSRMREKTVFKEKKKRTRRRKKKRKIQQSI